MIKKLYKPNETIDEYLAAFPKHTYLVLGIPNQLS